MIKNYFIKLFDFKYLWFFLPALLFILYVPQMVMGAVFYADSIAFSVAGIILLGLFSYLSVFLSLSRTSIFGFAKSGSSIRREFSSHYAIVAISLCYFTVIGYAVLTSERIALWDAISGASTDDIAIAREVLFKTRFGWERSLAYANSFLSTALMPFVVVMCYLEKRKYRHVLLLMFVLSLLPSLEKSLILKALLPFIVLGFNGYFSTRRVFQFLFIAALIFMGAFYFSRMGQVDNFKNLQESTRALQGQQIRLEETERKRLKSLEELRAQRIDYGKLNASNVDIELNRNALSQLNTQIDFYEHEQLRQINEMKLAVKEQLASDLVEKQYLQKYNVFGAGRLAFAVNRLLWIPYITAYDWLSFFQAKLGGEYLLGRTSSLLGWIAGQPAYPMEQEVFKYQFGSGVETAAANACFLVDAFVNFGWLGVFLYSAIFAVITRVIMVMDNPAMKACYYYFALQVSMGGLTGVLFSNGMLAVLLLAIFIRPKIVHVTL